MAVTIKKKWLDTVGGVKVERISGVKRSGVTADLSRPAKGVIHTTEGGWDGSLSVFKNRTGTPTFMVGRDGSGRLRVAQFMPIGEMSLTLENHSGGVETNRWTHVQIEVVGFSRKTFGWMHGHDHGPMDEKTKDVIADLVRQASEAAGIPLVHAGAGMNKRFEDRWRSRAGWFGHSEVPENSHWDPGEFDWADLFKRAQPAQKQVQFQLWIHEGGRTVKVDESAWAGVPGKRRFGLFYARVLPKVLEHVLAGKRPFFRRKFRSVES